MNSDLGSIDRDIALAESVKALQKDIFSIRIALREVRRIVATDLKVVDNKLADLTVLIRRKR